MAAKGGKDFLLKVETTTDVFQTVGGLRATSFTKNAEAIDATNHGSNQNREILNFAGIKSMSISGSGIFTDDANLATIEDAHDSQELKRFQVVDADDGRTYTAYFKITTFERSGDYNNEQSYSISLESSGAVTVS